MQMLFRYAKSESLEHTHNYHHDVNADDDDGINDTSKEK